MYHDHILAEAITTIHALTWSLLTDLIWIQLPLLTCITYPSIPSLLLLNPETEICPVHYFSASTLLSSNRWASRPVEAHCAGLVTQKQCGSKERHCINHFVYIWARCRVIPHINLDGGDKASVWNVGAFIYPHSSKSSLSYSDWEFLSSSVLLSKFHRRTSVTPHCCLAHSFQSLIVTHTIWYYTVWPTDSTIK
jgi:hypothetical protein